MIDSMIVIALIKRVITKFKQWKYKQSSNKVFLYEGVNVRESILSGHITLFKDVCCIECEIGEYSYVQQKSFLMRTKVGKFCSIADHVRTGFGNHPIDSVSTWPGFYYDTTSELKYSFYKGDPEIEIFRTVGGGRFLVEIGNDVWIGSHVLIMDGVRIGDGAIIAAGAVVTKDVEPYAIYGGVPARLIKYRFPKETIDVLLKLKWWDKDIEWIKSKRNLFNQSDEFLKSSI